MIAGVVLGLALLLGLIGVQRLRRYRSVFRMPARRDDRLAFRGPHQTFEVSLASDGFDAPSGLVARGQTTFLILVARATWIGRFVDPFIEIRSGSMCYRQYFERGAVGRRLVNLSPLFQHSDGGPIGRVALRGRALRWDSSAEMIAFEVLAEGGGKTLVLAPHPDDAEIAAFGMYASHPSWVVTITAGERGTADLSTWAADADERAFWYARLRVWDSLTVPQFGGVAPERCLNLVYPDGQLARMHGAPAKAFQLACEPRLSRASLRAANRAVEFRSTGPGCTWPALVEDLQTIIDQANPDIIITPHPMLDCHQDHVFTTVALEQALRATRSRPLLLLYSVHSAGAPLHPFGPVSAAVSPPPWSDERWLADAIYSHPLSAARQKEKYFAVDAAHDLRTYPDGAPPTSREVAVGSKRSLSALLSGMGLHPITHQRRAPRPNELYYVVDLSSLSELVGRALGENGAVDAAAVLGRS